MGTNDLINSPASLTNDQATALHRKKITKFILQRRVTQLVNTDPQRRCYNGCHFSSELVWSQWCDFLAYDTREKAERSKDWWEGLNRIGLRNKEYRIVQQQS